MTPLPAVRPWLKPLRLPESNRPRLPTSREEHDDDTDNLRAEEREARQAARFAALDRRDRSGPTR